MQRLRRRERGSSRSRFDAQPPPPSASRAQNNRAPCAAKDRSVPAAPTSASFPASCQVGRPRGANARRETSVSSRRRPDVSLARSRRRGRGFYCCCASGRVPAPGVALRGGACVRDPSRRRLFYPTCFPHVPSPNGGASPRKKRDATCVADSLGNAEILVGGLYLARSTECIPGQGGEIVSRNRFWYAGMCLNIYAECASQACQIASIDDISLRGSHIGKLRNATASALCSCSIISPC